MAKTREGGSIHMTAYSIHMAQSNLHVLTERKRSSPMIDIKWRKIEFAKFSICISVEENKQQAFVHICELKRIIFIRELVTSLSRGLPD